MNDGTRSTDGRRFDEAGTEKRHRYPGQRKISQGPGRDEEGASEEFPDIGAPPGEVEAADGHQDASDGVDRDDHGCLRSSADTAVDFRSTQGAGAARCKVSGKRRDVTVRCASRAGAD